ACPDEVCPPQTRERHAPSLSRDIIRGRRVALQPEAIPLVSLISQGQLNVMLRTAAYINIAARSSLFEDYCHG
ncbi:TPA: hypothetical protein ACGPDZ_005739, partial [Klebsiella variicola]